MNISVKLPQSLKALSQMLVTVNPSISFGIISSLTNP